MKIILLFLILNTCHIFNPFITQAQTPDLGVATDFALFTAVGAFSNTGATLVTGNIGTNVGAFSGFPPGTVIGNIHVADPVSVQAAIDVDEAYSEISAVTCGQVIGTTLGNDQILTPDVYCLGAASTLNGTLFLDGECDADAIFIIKIDGALSTEAFSQIVLLNGASVCNIYWQINGAVELGTGSTFIGTMLVNGAISLLAEASLSGRGLSRAGAIELSDNVVDLNEQPSASVIFAEGLTTFCEGGEVTLYGNCGGVWSNGETTSFITVTTSGSYFVTNSNNCGSDSSNIIMVIVNELPDCAITGDLFICTGQTTELCVALGAETYLWSTGATSNCLETAIPGTYSVTVTSAAGCVSTCSVTVTEAQEPACTISGDLLICTGETTELCVPTGAESYLWSTGATSNCIETAIAGNYSVTVTSIAGCVSTCNVTVTEAQEPACTISGDLLICTGETTELCVPTGAESYLWSTGATSNCIETAIAGNYSVTVTSIAGCVSTCNVTVTEAQEPACTISGDLLICTGETTELCVPTGAESYLWSTGATSNCIETAIPGNYSVTVTSITGCVSTCSVTVTEAQEPACTISGDLFICTGETTELCVPLGAESYLWSTGATSNCIETAIAGNYSVTVTSITGCVSTCSVTVIEAQEPSCTISGDLIICTGETTELCVSTGAESYLWSTGATSNCIETAIPGTYSVTVTSAEGCISSCSVLVVEEEVLDLSICDLGALSITIECNSNPESQIADWVAANISILTDCLTAFNIEFQVTSNVADVDFVEDCSATTGEITVTFTVIDACGNEITTDATLTIVDTSAPDISNCSNTDLTLVCEGTENETNAGNWNLANIESLLGCVTDACSETFVVISDFDWDNFISNCGDAGSIVVTYQVVDECGNISEDFVSTLFIEDTTPPVVEILDELFVYNGLVEVECNSNIEDWEYPTLTLEEIATSDNCGSVILTLENEFAIADDCTESGFMMEHNYLITAIDQCDNVTTVELTVRIVDTIAPEIFGVPEDITVDCANIPECPGTGTCDDMSAELVTSFDDCECASLSYEEITLNQTCEFNYTLIRRWTATDNCGNVTVEEQIITVQDATAPELILANPSIRDIQNGEEIKIDCEAWGLPDWVMEIDENAVLAIDGCSGEIDVAFTETVEHGFQCITDGYFDKISYNWSAEDACGNVSAFGFVILLTDNTAPVISGPQTICDPNPENSGLEVIDACSSAISWGFEDKVMIDDCMGEGILREWLAVDACNNMSFFEQHIFQDMPSPSVEINSDMIPEGTENGNVLQLNCSNDYMLEEFRNADVTLLGGCDGDLVVEFTEEVISQSGCENNIHTMMVLRWTTTDRCGQEGVYEIFLNLVDDNAPSFFGNAREISFECGEEIELPTVTDNCSAVDLLLMSQDTIPGVACANDMILEQVFQASDMCGNTSEFKRRVNVVDTKAPKFVSIKEVICIGETNEPEVIDGCGGEVELSFQDLAPIDSCGNISSVRRVWTAIDACGNSSSFEQTVIMSNNFGNIEVMNPFLGKLSENETYTVECSIMPSDIVEAFKPSDVTAFSNCSIVEVNVKVRLNNEGDCSVDGYLYDFKITYMVENVCLGKTEFSVNVQIVDNTAPVFEYAPEDIEIYCESEDALEQPIIVDDCSDVSVTYNEVKTNIGGDGTDGNYRLTRTWIATDRCGNTSTHTQRVRFYSYELEAEIILVNPPQCNSDRNQATVILDGTFKYEWTIISGECEILGNRFLPTIRYKIGFSPVTLQVKITDAFNCVVIRTITIVCTDIEMRSTTEGNILETVEMILYPNPSQGRFTLEWTNESDTEEVEIRIYNVRGEIHEVRQTKQMRGLNKIEFMNNGIAPGVYHLEMVLGEKIWNKRFVVIR